MSQDLKSLNFNYRRWNTKKSLTARGSKHSSIPIEDHSTHQSQVNISASKIKHNLNDFIKLNKSGERVLLKLLNKFNIRWCTNVFSIKIKNIIMIILNLILYFFQLYNIYYDCLIYWTFSPSISTYDFTNHSRSKLNLSDYLKRVIKCGCDYFHHLIDFSKLLHFLLALFLFIKIVILILKQLEGVLWSDFQNIIINYFQLLKSIIILNFKH